MWSPRTTAKLAERTQVPLISPLLAINLATEYSRLSEPRALPRGLWLIPSETTLARWQGVLFLHNGPYADGVLRLVMEFSDEYPKKAPTVTFESEVYHPLIDSKTRVWQPCPSLIEWQSDSPHLSRFLYALKRCFQAETLDQIAEHEVANKQIWSLYQHSRQTFLSMTRQRSLASSSSPLLYPIVQSSEEGSRPPSLMSRPSSPSAQTDLSRPQTPQRARHTRQISATGSVGSKGTVSTLFGAAAGAEPGSIQFRPLVKGEEQTLRRRVGLDCR